MTGTAALTLLVGITKRWEKLDAGQPSTAQGERETVEGLPRRGRGDVYAEPLAEMPRTHMTASQQWKRRASSRCTNSAARN
jgi:hypothetical protein